MCNNNEEMSINNDTIVMKVMAILINSNNILIMMPMPIHACHCLLYSDDVIYSVLMMMPMPYIVWYYDTWCLFWYSDTDTVIFIDDILRYGIYSAVW